MMRMSMNTASSGSGRVDDIKSHLQGELRGLTELVKITEDVRNLPPNKKFPKNKRSKLVWNKKRKSL